MGAWCFVPGDTSIVGRGHCVIVSPYLAVRVKVFSLVFGPKLVIDCHVQS